MPSAPFVDFRGGIVIASVNQYVDSIQPHPRDLCVPMACRRTRVLSPQELLAQLALLSRIKNWLMLIVFPLLCVCLGRFCVCACLFWFFPSVPAYPNAYAGLLLGRASHSNSPLFHRSDLSIGIRTVEEDHNSDCVLKWGMTHTHSNSPLPSLQ